VGGACAVGDGNAEGAEPRFHVLTVLTTHYISYSLYITHCTGSMESAGPVIREASSSNSESGGMPSFTNLKGVAGAVC
jgi:hypothetical protein